MHNFLQPPKYENQNNYQQEYIDHNIQNNMFIMTNYCTCQAAHFSSCGSKVKNVWRYTSSHKAS